MQNHQCQTVIVEDTGLGTGLWQDLAREGIGLIPIKPLIDKATRLQVGSAKIEQGRLYLPESTPWLHEFEREVLTFPHGRHDDQVDSMSQFLFWLGAQYFGSLQTSYSARL